MTESVRCFFAIPVPDPVRDILARAMHAMRSRPNGDRVRWVAMENLHVTLRFLGEVPLKRLPDVGGAVAREVSVLPGFECELGEIHPFPRTRNPRVLAATLHTESGQLNELALAVEQGVVAAGHLADPRGFRAHLTVGRLLGHAHPALRDDAGVVGAKLVVDRVVLMRSDLRPEGSVYTELESIPLRTVDAGSPIPDSR